MESLSLRPTITRRQALSVMALMGNRMVLAVPITGCYFIERQFSSFDLLLLWLRRLLHPRLHGPQRGQAGHRSCEGREIFKLLLTDLTKEPNGLELVSLTIRINQMPDGER